MLFLCTPAHRYLSIPTHSVPTRRSAALVLRLGALLAGYGLASALAILRARRGNDRNMLSSIVGDFAGMPVLMKRLALVQFFSWSALFIMWINTTPKIGRAHV